MSLMGGNFVFISPVKTVLISMISMIRIYFQNGTERRHLFIFHEFVWKKNDDSIFSCDLFLSKLKKNKYVLQ